MVDDGTAGNLFIPSLLIRKEAADKIMDYVNKKKNRVILALKFEMAHPDNTVEYELWMTSSNPLARQFLYNFSAIAK